jgi:adenine-specific DNA methylase
LRLALLDFIADFANHDASSVPSFRNTAQTLTEAAGTTYAFTDTATPLVFDPFAGGGAIPVEAARAGARVFASDLNPLPVLLNQILLESIPRYGKRLAEAVQTFGEWIEESAKAKLKAYYPPDDDGAVPVAYIWARTISCEGPDCGVEVPLTRSWSLCTKRGKTAALRPRITKGAVELELVFNPSKRDIAEGTVRRGAATCLDCGYTTPVANVREQLTSQRGGASSARLLCVVTTRQDERGRFFRLPTAHDMDVYDRARKELERIVEGKTDGLSPVPDEHIGTTELRRISVPIYGMTTWGDLFSPRQALSLALLSDLVQSASPGEVGLPDDGLFRAAQRVCALCVSRLSDISNSLCSWSPSTTQVLHLFTRQAIGIVWDFAEASPLSGAAGDFGTTLGNVLRVLKRESSLAGDADVMRATATQIPLPDESAHLLFTDPPYYDSVAYAHLSDFFYVWLRRCLEDTGSEDFASKEAPKEDEIVVDRPHEKSSSKKDVQYYETELTRAFADARRVIHSHGIGVVVFASKTTRSWEAFLRSVIDAGWMILGSWPIDTERVARISARGQARLGSSIHIVCRPRHESERHTVGDWKDILQELPRRIHSWMPRLADEGIVGADAIFACLGPALEVFSRHSRVEKASGEQLKLPEYLEHVWSAVAQEALSMIFEDADVSGLEQDARLTAMWLWTLNTAQPSSATTLDEGKAADDSAVQGNQFVLEFDAARKIAQGLGAHLENLSTVVEIKGEEARLLSVTERAKHLFAKGTHGDTSAFGTNAKGGKKTGRKTKKNAQMTLFDEVDRAAIEQGWADAGAPTAGETTLSQVHQAMLLFGVGRAEALRRFLVDEGVGGAGRFWRLAQSLSALYPPHTEEKRWIDGVLARKKGLGFG